LAEDAHGSQWLSDLAHSSTFLGGGVLEALLQSDCAPLKAVALCPALIMSAWCFATSEDDRLCRGDCAVARPSAPIPAHRETRNDRRDRHIYTNGDLGIATLGFKRSPESSILIERKAGA
jgi:hypothetical protein